MASSQEQSYSTLEAVVPNYKALEHARRPDYSTLHHDQTHSGLEVVYQAEGRDSEKQTVAENGLEVGSEPTASLRHPAVSRRNGIFVTTAVILVVILGAILGGVLGSRHHQSKSSTGASTAGTNPPSSNPSNSSTTVSTSPSLSQRNIAAVSFVDLSRNNTRLYFQDDAGHNAGRIRQGINDERNRLKWTFQTIINSDAKLGTPLAAAVSRPGFPLVYHILLC
jgi:hypothetical protein